jgi:hypothetical protein
MPTLPRAALVGLATLLVASAAGAQVQPPAPTSPPPATEPGPPPPAVAPAPPPAGTAPVTPLPPTLAPEPTSAPPLQLTERTSYEQQGPHPEPFYRQWWFWGAVGVVAATVAIILVWNLGSNDAGPPATTFGNMHAF